MPPLFESFSSVGANSPSSIDGSEPSGTVEGDVLVAQLSAARGSANPPDPDTPDDWTKVRTDLYSGPSSNRNRQTVFLIVRGASAPDLTFSGLGGDGQARLTIARISGSTGVLADHSGVTSTGTSGTDSLEIPELVGLPADCLMLGLFSTRGTGNTISSPGSMTERWHQSQGSATGAGATEAPSAGDTGSRTFTTENASQLVGALIALEPPLVEPVTVSAPTATATATAPAPAVVAQQAQTVDAPSAQATAQAPAPEVVAQQAVTVSAPTASASAQAPAPTVVTQRSAVVSAPSAQASAEAPAPQLVTERTVEVQAPSAETSAEAPTPTIVAGDAVTISAPSGAATAQAPVPTVVGQRVSVVTAPTADATAEAPAPVVVAVQAVSISAPTAEANTEAPAPEVKTRRRVLVLAPFAIAAAHAPTPAVGEIAVFAVRGRTKASVADSRTRALVRDSTTKASVRDSRTRAL